MHSRAEYGSAGHTGAVYRAPPHIVDPAVAELEGAAAARPASLLWWMTFERQGWMGLVGLASEEGRHDIVGVNF